MSLDLLIVLSITLTLESRYFTPMSISNSTLPVTWLPILYRPSHISKMTSHLSPSRPLGTWSSVSPWPRLFTGCWLTSSEPARFEPSPAYAIQSSVSIRQLAPRCPRDCASVDTRLLRKTVTPAVLPRKQSKTERDWAMSKDKSRQRKRLACEALCDKCLFSITSSDSLSNWAAIARDSKSFVR